MSNDCLLYICFGGSFGEVQGGVEGVEFEEVAMLPVGRAGALVDKGAAGISAVGAERFGMLGDCCGGGRDVEEDPMVPHLVFADIGGNVGVIQEQGEGFGLGGDAADVERGIDLLPFTGVFRRDLSSFGEGWAGEFHGGTSFSVYSIRVFWEGRERWLWIGAVFCGRT